MVLFALHDIGTMPLYEHQKYGYYLLQIFISYRLK